MKSTFKKAVSMLVLSAMLMSSSAILRADAVINTVTYKKYICSTNTVSTYSLSQNDQASSTQTYGLVGLDNRVVKGHSGIVRLSNDCTGFIVDDHTIATAAHCVSKVGHGEDVKSQYIDSYYFIPNMQVYLYNEDGTPKNTAPLDVVEIHIPCSYETNPSKSNDFALITVNEDLSGYTHFNLGIPYNMNTASFLQIPLFVSGIPSWTGTPSNPQTNENKLVYTGIGYEATDGHSSSSVLCYTCDTVGGNSGSPVYAVSNCTVGSEEYKIYTAIAIHSGAGESAGNNLVYYNKGSTMTSSKLQFYLNNPNIDY